MQKIDRTGESRIMHNGIRATITAYRNCLDIDVQFENGVISTHKEYRTFQRGNIRCPMVIEQIGDYSRVTNYNQNPVFSFIMDTEDVHLLGNWAWSPTNKNKAYASAQTNKGLVILHRLIINTPDDMFTDHINGNKLDNRKSNLRICTNSENIKNRKALKINTSGYKGVYWAKHRKMWCAAIRAGSKSYTLGHFDNKIDAARAYNAAAIELHGEFACLNDV